MQRPKNYIVAGLLLCAAFLPTSLVAQTGPGGAPLSTLPPSALPPSFGGQSLIRTPNPMDRTSDLSITGNVRGGKYFRGSVPYRGSTSFGRTTPSSSLDSFMRDSAGSEDVGSFSRRSSRYGPYYSPTQTVTTTTPDSSEVTRPPTMNIGGYTARAPVLETSSLSRADSMLESGYVAPLRRSRPMSMTIQEIEKQISSDIDEYPQFQKPADRQYQPVPEQFKYRSAVQLDGNSPDLSERITAKDSSLMPFIKKERPEDTREAGTQEQKAREGEYGEESSEEPSAEFLAPKEQPPEEQMDVYGQMKQQLDALQEKIDLVLAEGQTEEQAESKFGSLSGVVDANTSQGYKMPQQDLYAPKIADIDPSVTKEAEDILGPYHTFASFSESKFNKHMAAAELYIEQGRYYRAADAYTLASIYKPDDPLAYVGKSHALFASGEYMSSALFLSRALDMFPEYAQLKIDIETLTGGSENLQARVADVEEWLGRSDAPELHFLLAYVYYQMNETDLAQKAIDAAYEKASKTPAVLTLKKAIEDSI